MRRRCAEGICGVADSTINQFGREWWGLLRRLWRGECGGAEAGLLGGVGLAGGVEEGGVFQPEGGAGGVKLDSAALPGEGELELAELAAGEGAAFGDIAPNASLRLK